MNRFENRVVLITGAGSGIGQATVARILAEGGTVLAADISEEGLGVTRARAEEAGDADRLTTLVVDVADENSVQQAIGGAILLGGITMAHLGNDAAVRRLRQRDRQSTLVDRAVGAAGIDRK